MADQEPIDLEAYRADIERAHTEVGDIARAGYRRWRMSIPAQPDRDSDLLISTGLRRGERLADEVERLGAERDRWKREHDELFLTWQILAERTLVASTLVAEDMPADVEAELAPVRMEVLRRVLAGETGRDDLVAFLLPSLAEAERRRDAQTETEVERLRAVIERAFKEFDGTTPGGRNTKLDALLQRAADDHVSAEDAQDLVRIVAEFRSRLARVLAALDGGQ